jgi:hypothetical protein
VKRTFFGVALGLVALLFLGSPSQAASATAARYQLRGHLPELGERPTTRVFLTQTAYDAYRSSLGDANVFPPASSLFMSFDKEILALYTRGNDTGGRCLATPILAAFSGDTLTASLTWQSGTCGAPSSAHYPFILMSIARQSTDGTAWLQSARSVCAVVDTPETSACASLSAASPSPSPAPTSAAPSPTPSPAASASPSPTATRSLTPTQSAPPATPTPSPASTAAATVSRPPVAAASPTPVANDSETNYLLYAMLVAIAFLVLLSLFLSRSGGARRRH